MKTTSGLSRREQTAESLNRDLDTVQTTKEEPYKPSMLYNRSTAVLSAHTPQSVVSRQSKYKPRADGQGRESGGRSTLQKRGEDSILESERGYTRESAQHSLKNDRQKTILPASTAVETSHMISHRLMEKDNSVTRIVPDQHYTSLPSLPQILPGRSRNGLGDVGGNQTHTDSYSLGPLYEKPYGSAKNKSLLVS